MIKARHSVKLPVTVWRLIGLFVLLASGTAGGCTTCVRTELASAISPSGNRTAKVQTLGCGSANGLIVELYANPGAASWNVFRAFTPPGTPLDDPRLRDAIVLSWKDESTLNIAYQTWLAPVSISAFYWDVTIETEELSVPQPADP